MRTVSSTIVEDHAKKNKNRMDISQCDIFHKNKFFPAAVSAFSHQLPRTAGKEFVLGKNDMMCILLTAKS